MNKKLLLAGSIRMMSRYKLRTFFMSIGVALGVAALVAGRSLGTVAEQEIMERVNRMFGPGTILVMSGGPAASQSRAVTPLEIEDLEALAEGLDSITAWDPVVRTQAEVRYEGTTRSGAVLGHSEHADVVWSRAAIDGRFITAEDVASRARVAMVGTLMAESLFGDASPLGEEILINSVPFRIVGVLESIGIDPHGEDRDEDIYVPTTTAMRRLLNVDSISYAKLVVREPETVDEVATQVAEILRGRHGILEGEPDDFALYTSKFAGRKVMQANRALEIYLPAAAGVVLLVAAIVISSIMLTTIRERVAEIGLRKAVGATEQHISYQFLSEAVSVTILSGVLGLALGALAIAVAASTMNLPTVVTAESIALGLAAAIVVGVVSGLVPARRAARLDPVEALR